MSSLSRLRRAAPAATDVPVASTTTATDLRTRQKFVRRQHWRRWRVWRVAIATVLTVALVAGGIWAVYFSTFLAVDSVQVRGTEFLTPSEVRAAAQVPIGEPLATVDLDAMKARVEALAPARSVEITRLWPNQVLIELVERKVLATVEVGGEVRAMDADGVLFRRYAQPPRQYPRIRSDRAIDTESLQEAGKVLGSLPSDVAKRVSFVSVESIDRISLILRDGRTILWGSAENSADKARVIAKLLARQARSYDVSVPGLPTFRS